MTSSPAASDRRPTTDVIGEITGAYITELQRGYLQDRPAAVAALAQLRRGAGKVPEDVPELWGVTGTENLFAEDVELPGHAKDKAEAAHFLAVTLYALHQQSRPDKGMHRRHRDAELGAAVRQLMPNGDIDEAIRRRFVRVGTATTRDALASRLREMISLLRGKSIPLDYALLAGQLYQAQLPDGMRKVRQSWGRSFHAYRPSAAATAGDAESPKKDLT
ncbi:type I-E CRISPR-associated protein Cse2/CasB [Sphaerisporangium sp. NPDC051011]|uniref:type I-E CRISPR-associated protein Cse2/CasB n=1 Tax=Sphaerisporangium sp. NPDC051011 TaxID=3155792 RepID=UPI003402E0F2